MTTESQQKLFELRYRTGLCRTCGKPRQDPGRVMCKACRKEQSEQARLRYREGRTLKQKNQKLGLCRCGAALPADWTINGRPRLICPECKVKNENWRRG